MIYLTIWCFGKITTMLESLNDMLVLLDIQVKQLKRSWLTLWASQRAIALEVPHDLPRKPSHWRAGHNVVSHRVRDEVEDPILPKSHLWKLEREKHIGPKHDQGEA